MTQGPIVVAEFQLLERDLKDPRLTYLNTRLQQLVGAVNRLAGNHGAAVVNDGLQAASLSSGGAKWTAGKGNPNGIVAGNVGDLYTRTDGGAGTTLYVKEALGGQKTGWVAK